MFLHSKNNNKCLGVFGGDAAASGTEEEEWAQTAKTNNTDRKILTIDRKIYITSELWVRLFPWRSDVTQSLLETNMAERRVALRPIRASNSLTPSTQRRHASAGVPCTLKRYMHVYSGWPQLVDTWTSMIWKVRSFSSCQNKKHLKSFTPNLQSLSSWWTNTETEFSTGRRSKKIKNNHLQAPIQLIN